MHVLEDSMIDELDTYLGKAKPSTQSLLRLTPEIVMNGCRGWGHKYIRTDTFFVTV